MVALGEKIEAVLAAAWRSSPAATARYLSTRRCTACQRNDPTAPHSCWSWPHHLDYLSSVLVDVAMGRCSRLIINAPPRHGKSDLVSKWFPLWFLELFSNLRMILCSYEAMFAARWGRAVRNEIVEHKDLLSVRLANDSQASDDWETTEGGGMKTAGVGGPITGRGGNIMLLNDPIKNWEQAASITYRDRLWDWFDTTFLTRCEPGAAVVVEMTRWHEDDLTGRIMNSDDADQWRVLRMPAIATEGDEVGRRLGEPLWPQRYDAAALQRVKRRSGYTWGSLYQQDPPSLDSNSVYHSFSDTNIQQFELEPDRPLHLSVDFNIDPGMHSVIGQSFDDLENDDVLLTARCVIHERSMTVERMMQAFARWIKDQGGWQWTELFVFGDASGGNRWAGNGKTAWHVVYEALDRSEIPYRIKVSSSNPAVSDRVLAVNAAMLDMDGKFHYIVHPDAEKLIDDYRAVKWDGNEINKKDRKLSHPSDAEGYRVLRLRPIRRLETKVGRVAVAGARR